MCVSAGKSVGEIAWRRCEGIGSSGHVVGWLERRSLDTSASVWGQKEKRGVLAVDVVGLSSCVCGAENWLLIVLVLSVKNVTKSSAVIEVVGGGQSREFNVLKRLRVSGVLLILLWKYEDLAVWTWAEKDESKHWYILWSDRSFDLRHFLSAALSLDRCSRRTSDNQGLEGAACAGLDERGQISSIQEFKVEHKVSVAALTSRDEKWVGEGREEGTTEERWEGERERRFRLKVTGRGVGGTQVGRCRLNVMKKWSEMCRDFTKMLSAVQFRVKIKSSWLPDLWVLVVVKHLKSNEARSEWKSAA